MSSNGWTGVILAGGRSRRMGQDKALMPLHAGGPTMLDHALDLISPVVDDLLVVGVPEAHGHVGPFVIPDDHPGLGPLGGLITAMRYASHDRLLVIAVDMPCLTTALFERLKRELGHFTDAAVPIHGGRPEPLVGAYHRRCASPFRERMTNGQLKMSEALDAVRTTWVEIGTGSGDWPEDLFHNVNHPEDLGST
jgi:molybdenum cofactor guanylyltransferase